ncbi:hypothetical protein ACFV4Q_04055 [Streptomyces nojiriensis]|uniref:hypothetical protein n=1 Tax=Streptomyces nojiriensis TaxID=66374 RepID=UPI0036556EEE
MRHGSPGWWCTHHASPPIGPPSSALMAEVGIETDGATANLAGAGRWHTVTASRSAATQHNQLSSARHRDARMGDGSVGVIVMVGRS